MLATFKYRAKCKESGEKSDKAREGARSQVIWVGHLRFNFFFKFHPRISLLSFRERRKGKGEEQGWRGER